MLKSRKKSESNGIHRIEHKRFMMDIGEGDVGTIGEKNFDGRFWREIEVGHDRLRREGLANGELRMAGIWLC
jgi:hypothetical protein